MNRLLDRFCLLTLAVVLLALFFSLSTRVATAAPEAVPDCTSTCQMVWVGKYCSVNTAYKFDDETCWPARCVYTGAWGNSCIQYGTTTVYTCSTGGNCYCDPNTAVKVEAFHPVNIDETPITEFALYICVYV